MNKKITASLCAILILLAGCAKREKTPDLEVSPENAPTEAKETVVRKQVAVSSTPNSCWVKVDNLLINTKQINLMYARHSIDEYGVYMAAPAMETLGTRVFIATDKPEETIDAIMVATTDCK